MPHLKMRTVDRWLFFFFSSRRRHTRCYRDWSSDVCSSDLLGWSEEPRACPTARTRRRTATQTSTTPGSTSTVGDRRCHVALLDLRDEARRHACELGELLARQVSTAAGLPLPSSLPVRDYGVSA